MQTTEQLGQNELARNDNGCLMSQTSCPSTKLMTKGNPSFAIAECQAENKKTTLQGRSHICDNSSKTLTSCKMSEADSISKGKDFSPFYDGLCKEISSHLLSHTEIDCADSASNCSNLCSNKTVENSWFSISQRFHPNKNSQKTFSQYFMPSLADCMVLGDTRIKSRKIRIYPTRQQKTLFNQWFGISRLCFNKSVDKYNNRARDCKDSWMDIAKQVLSENSEDYVKEVPYQIKKIAVKDCYASWINNSRKAKKTGVPFKLSFRSRKNPEQSCYIPKNAVKENGIYYTIAGKLKYSEREWFGKTIQDCRLVKEYDRWYIVIPMAIKTEAFTENQGDVVAIDPGMRSFLTYFSSDGQFGQFGRRSFERVLNLQLRIDKLISKKSLSKDKKEKVRLYRVIGKARHRLEDLVDELHWKCANYFAKSFKVVIFPPFNVSGMVKKGKRKLRRSVVRSMQSFRFFDFKQRLKQKCHENGVVFIEQNESYTSKTNSFNGKIIDNLGSKEWFNYDGVTVNRDINAARNILILALRDSSAMTEMSLLSNTIVTAR